MRSVTLQPIGFMLLVGVNEELVSRGVVLERMRRSFGPYAAVGITAALFGLQHLSAFATTGRGGYDIAVVGTLVVFLAYGIIVIRGRTVPSLSMSP